ncbi:MAG: sugar-binding protein, partial [Oscillospiraceae bacterium]
MKKLIAMLLTVTLMVSVMPIIFVNAENISGWNIQLSGGVDSTATVVNDPKTGEKNMVLANKSEVGPNKFMLVTTDVQVEEGKTYVYGFRAKADSVKRAYVMINWGTRNELYPFSDTYDWTNYEFLYNHISAESTITLQFLVEDVTKALTIDDVYFYEYNGNGKVGDNKIENSTFGSASTTNNETQELSYEKKVTNIKTSKTFVEPEFNKILSGFKYAPVYKAKNVKVDGDISEWGSYPKFEIPILKEQYQIYMDSKLDVTASMQYAYDDDNLYLAMEVMDDKHVSINNGDYWKSDSVQICLSEYGETYGLELGMVIGQDGNANVYSSALTQEQIDTINLKTSKTNEKLIYEVAIPWSIKYKQVPKEILFNALVNVDDGKGRAYCVQLARGISEGKFNTEFPRLQMLEQPLDYETFIEGEANLIQKQKSKYSFYFVNMGGAKNVTIEIPSINIKKELTIGENQGVREELELAFEKTGKNQIVVYLTIDGKKQEVNFDVNVTLSLDTFDEKYFKGLEEKRLELKKLLDECESKEIATDYEKVNYTVFE